jgi:hypothetical protein
MWLPRGERPPLGLGQAAPVILPERYRRPDVTRKAAPRGRTILLFSRRMSTPSALLPSRVDWQDRRMPLLRLNGGVDVSDRDDETFIEDEEQWEQTVVNDAVAGETLLPGRGEGNAGPTGGAAREQEPISAENDLADEEIDLDEEPD